ncbi:MAG: hypothetical protein J5692_04710, partial [Bacteroidales bacterium]|nr:hypothetical protein [Bacteroidales bacterium]
DVWEGISAGLDRRHRRMVFRRFAVGAVAAAAGLAIALLVFRGPRTGGQVEAPVRTAHAVQPFLQETPAAVHPDVAPIATQIAAFTKNQVVAQAIVPKNVPASAAEMQPVSETSVDAPANDNPVVETPAANVPSSVDNPAAPEQRQLTEEDLPADFWREDVPASKTHTSHLSILSNITTVASDNDLIYKASPMHSSSQSGNRASSVVEPVAGTPKFFSPLSLGLQLEVPLAGRVSLASGVTYSYLVSQYDMLVDKVRYEGAYNQLHYVGIPLSLSLHLVETPSFGFYASAGGAVEKCVAQRYVFASNTLSEKVGGLQWSARVGLGAEYWVIPNMGLYFDPSLVYYFDNQQPLSIRTQQPLQARFEVGLRFKL